MPRKNLLNKCLPIILATSMLPNATIREKIKLNIFKYKSIDPTTTETYNEKVGSAIKKFLESQTFLFFHINNFEDLKELNESVLPVLLKKLSSSTLKFNHEDLIYNQKDLLINQYLKMTEKQLIIELKYLSKIFTVNLALVTEIDDDILAKAIKILFDKIALDNKNLLTFYEWEETIDTFNQTKQWIKQTLKNKPLKINNRITIANCNKFNAFLIDLDQWKQTHKIFLTYTFGDSQAFTLQVSINELITKLEVSNAIQSIINQSQDDFILNKSTSYKNFDQLIYEKQWKQQIETIFANNSLEIKHQKIAIKQQDITINFDKNLQITPWTTHFKIECIYKIGKTAINFYLPIMLDKTIDYNLITSSFITQIKDMKINGTYLKNRDIESVKAYLSDAIKLFFNKKIMIEGKEYDLSINDLQINDYNFFYKNDQGKVKINLFSLSLNKSAFNIELDLLQYELFFSQIIFDFLQKNSHQNPFDVSNQINENNTWYDVISKINQKMTEMKIDLSVAQQVIWEAYYGDHTSLNNKLSEDGVENTIDFKNVKLNIFGIKIPRYTLWVKNIFLSDKFKVDQVAKKFLLTQITNQSSVWPHWSIKDKVSADEIGINLPNKIYDVDINYFINEINTDLGFIIVNVIIQKNQALQEIKIKIKQFTSSQDLSNKITNFFAKDFDAKILNLTSQNNHYDAYKKAINYFEQIFGQNRIAIQEMIVINPDQVLQSSTLSKRQIVRFIIKIGNLNTNVNFCLININ